MDKERLKRVQHRRSGLFALLGRFDREEKVIITSQGPSRLQQLLEQNACGSDLNEQEKKEARILIDNLPLGDKGCWVCGFDKERNNRKVISGLDICRGHAGYALATRK